MGNHHKKHKEPPKDISRPRSAAELLALDATILQSIPPDMIPEINGYLIALRVKDRPTLKPTIQGQPYKLQFKFGCKGTKEGQLRNPDGMAMDHLGNIYISDSDTGRIQAFTDDGTFLRTFGSQGEGDGQLSLPSSLALDFDQNLVIADSGNNRVQIFTTAGQFKLKFSGPEDQPLDGPTGLTIDLDGQILVCDDSHRVHTFSPSGVWLRSFGLQGAGVGELSYPVGITVDTCGNIIVSEYGNSRIQVFSPAGESLRIFGEVGVDKGQLREPWGVSVDKNGLIISCDQENNRVQIFSPEGKYLTTFGSEELHHPLSALVDFNGRIFITDSDNCRVLVYAWESLEK